MLRFRTLLLAGALCLSTASAAFALPDAFAPFQKEAHRICPSHHLERLVEGNWFDILLDGKGPLFSASHERQLDAAQGHFGRVLDCANSVSVDCDVAARLYAIQSRRLMGEAARQICRDWRCLEEDTCTYSPSIKTHH
jgi:hypothetical protein